MCRGVAADALATRWRAPGIGDTVRPRSNVTALMLLGALALAAIGTASAGPVEDGVEAYRRGDYATALRLFRPLADQGIAPAQLNLGLMYSNGDGVPQNYTEALKWFRLAADQGDAAAQSNLGHMYDNGGVRRDYAEALKWYRLAADQGDGVPPFNLGVMYDNGVF
jgi:TPR repeat protein